MIRWYIKWNSFDILQCVNPGRTIKWTPGSTEARNLAGRIRGANVLPPYLVSDQSQARLQAWDFFAPHVSVQSHTSVQRSIVLPARDWSDWVAHFGSCETPQSAPKLWPTDPTYLFLDLEFSHYTMVTFLSDLRLHSTLVSSVWLHFVFWRTRSFFRWNGSMNQKKQRFWPQEAAFSVSFSSSRSWLNFWVWECAVCVRVTEIPLICL